MTTVQTLKQDLDRLSNHYYDETSIDKLREENEDLLVRIVDGCIKHDNQILRRIFQKAIRKQSVVIIMRLGVHLLHDLEYLKPLQFQQMNNIVELIIRILHSMYIFHPNKLIFVGAFFEYRYRSKSLFEFILQFIQRAREPNLIRVVCRWLDIISNYQLVFEKLPDIYEGHLDEISTHLIQRDDLLNDSEPRGSFLFFLGFSKNLKPKLDENKVKEWTQYIISKAKESKEWSSDTLHGVMGTIYLLNNLFRQELFAYDKEYLLSLLTIIYPFKWEESLLPTLTNNESLLIHGIVEYFYMAMHKSVECKAFVESTRFLFENLRQQVKCPHTRKNLSSILSLVEAEGDNQLFDEMVSINFDFGSDRQKKN